MNAGCTEIARVVVTMSDGTEKVIERGEEVSIIVIGVTDEGYPNGYHVDGVVNADAPSVESAIVSLIKHVENMGNGNHEILLDRLMKHVLLKMAR